MALTIGGKRVAIPGGSAPATPLSPLERLLVEGLIAVNKEIVDAINAEDFADAIRDLDPDLFDRLLNEVLRWQDIQEVLDNALRDVVLDGSLAEAREIIRKNPRIQRSPFADLQYSGRQLPSGIIVPSDLAGPRPDVEMTIATPVEQMFNYVSEASVNYSRVRSGQLIRSIDESTRVAVRELITQAFIEPRSVDDTAKLIRRIVGLHPRWARAVERFHDTNVRRLVDTGLSSSQAERRADEMTAKYREKLIRRRAEMIARTETQQALNFGRQMSWVASDRAGLVDPRTMKEWRTAPLGSRYGPPCPTCTTLRGTRVPWNGTFDNGQQMPPAHPNCRCTAVLIPPPRKLTGLPSQVATESWIEELEALEAEQIRELEAQRVQKHQRGKHDQSSHGRWATGSVWYAGNEVAPDLYEFHYGDMTFSRSTMYGIETIADAGIDTWGTWEGNYAMRSISAHMMGIKRPPTEGGDLVDAKERRAYENGDSTGLYDGARQRVEDNIYQTYAVMDAVHRSEPTTLPLYRGMQVPANSSVLEMKTGDEFMVPLSAFSFDQGLAQRFSEPSSAAPDNRSMILRLAPGAKGASEPMDYADTAIQVNDEWITVPDEVVTQGTFRVTNVEQTGDTFFVDIEHVDYMDVGGGGFVAVR